MQRVTRAYMATFTLTFNPTNEQKSAKMAHEVTIFNKITKLNQSTQYFFSENHNFDYNL